MKVGKIENLAIVQPTPKEMPKQSSGKSLTLTNLFKLATVGTLLITGSAILLGSRFQAEPYDPNACLNAHCITRNTDYKEFNEKNPFMPLPNSLEEFAYCFFQKICCVNDSQRNIKENPPITIPDRGAFLKYLNEYYSCPANHSV